MKQNNYYSATDNDLGNPEALSILENKNIDSQELSHLHQSTTSTSKQIEKKRKRRLKTQRPDFDLNGSITATSLPRYDGLTDRFLSSYFSHSAIRNILIRGGLIAEDGVILKKTFDKKFFHSNTALLAQQATNEKSQTKHNSRQHDLSNMTSKYESHNKSSDKASSRLPENEGQKKHLSEVYLHNNEELLKRPRVKNINFMDDNRKFRSGQLTDKLNPLTKEDLECVIEKYREKMDNPDKNMNHKFEEDQGGEYGGRMGPPSMNSDKNKQLFPSIGDNKSSKMKNINIDYKSHFNKNLKQGSYNNYYLEKQKEFGNVVDQNHDYKKNAKSEPYKISEKKAVKKELNTKNNAENDQVSRQPKQEPRSSNVKIKNSDVNIPAKRNSQVKAEPKSAEIDKKIPVKIQKNSKPTEKRVPKEKPIENKTNVLKNKALTTKSTKPSDKPRNSSLNNKKNSVSQNENKAKPKKFSVDIKVSVDDEIKNDMDPEAEKASEKYEEEYFEEEFDNASEKEDKPVKNKGNNKKQSVNSMEMEDNFEKMNDAAEEEKVEDNDPEKMNGASDDEKVEGNGPDKMNQASDEENVEENNPEKMNQASDEENIEDNKAENELEEDETEAERKRGSQMKSIKAESEEKIDPNSNIRKSSQVQQQNNNNGLSDDEYDQEFDEDGGSPLRTKGKEEDQNSKHDMEDGTTGVHQRESLKNTENKYELEPEDDGEIDVKNE